MNFKLTTAAATILAVGLVALSTNASAQAPTTAAKKHTTPTRKAAKAKPAGPTVEEQIERLRNEMQGQIDGLKNSLADKDAQLQRAQQAAADAQAAAARAEAAASAENQAVTANTAAVDTLQTTVTDLKGNQVSLATTVSDETANMKKAIDHPMTLHYKGITLTPGGFTAGETIYRTKATGGDIPTAFSALPYEGADAYSLSEFYGTARQSRIALMAEGKTNWGTLKGYYEADWLGTGTSSNNNQSNSYVMRQRVIWGSAETNSHWKFAGGQMWSLATEVKKGISNEPSDILTPLTIDPNYVTGFVWTRQYGFRIVKSFDHVAFGISAENPELLYTASIAGNTPYAVLGSAGNNGGNYNATISACSPSTSIVNYTNQKQTDSAGNTVNIAVPVYKTVNSCANVTNISFNTAPDVLAKIALDPGWGHYEIFGIFSTAQETVYPGETTNSNLYGGLKDIVSGLTVAPSLTSAGAYKNRAIMGGIGGSFRVPIIADKFTFGAKGLWGQGVGRYGDTTLSDLTANSSGEFARLQNVSGLLTAEITPNPRLVLYLNYGGDYAGRADSANPGATTLGAPSAAQSAAGVWGGTWKAPSAAALGYGSRLLSNSACGVVANPGYSGSSTGYYPGGSCGAQTRDVQEITGGWWYDIYKGDRGRFRQGFQYGYSVREGWSGAPPSGGGPGLGARGIDNMFWTSLRYYLP
jgi:FKBP-type peptidyl-prolyl cis-trans isomerase